LKKYPEPIPFYAKHGYLVAIVKVPVDEEFGRAMKG